MRNFSSTSFSGSNGGLDRAPSTTLRSHAGIFGRGTGAVRWKLRTRSWMTLFSVWSTPDACLIVVHTHERCCLIVARLIDNSNSLSR